MLCCHLNVEYCGTIRAVKYLYKYTYKGHDRATLEFSDDEVQTYLDARYVGPSEAAWRILGFPMHDKSHNIERLAVHLKGGETIVYHDGQEEAALGAGTCTTLTAWFALNAADPDDQEPQARNLLYCQIPEHFTWHRKEQVWKRRKDKAAATKVIGRMHAAVPSEGPRFYLYLLLLHIPGAKSFENLVIVRMPSGTPKICFEPDSNDAAGVVRDTHIPDYRRAAEERGLISTDDEYEEALREAAQYRSAPALRHLFALMLLHCELTKPADLFDTL